MTDHQAFSAERTYFYPALCCLNLLHLQNIVELKKIGHEVYSFNCENLMGLKLLSMPVQ